jgi:hypothetical protein
MIWVATAGAVMIGMIVGNKLEIVDRVVRARLDRKAESDRDQR